MLLALETASASLCGLIKQSYCKLAGILCEAGVDTHSKVHCDYTAMRELLGKCLRTLHSNLDCGMRHAQETNRVRS